MDPHRELLQAAEPVSGTGQGTGRNRVRLRHSIALLAVGVLLAGCVGPVRQQTLTRTRFDFALIGDLPYSDEAFTQGVPNLIQELNQARLAFVVHDGDIKFADAPCSDEYLLARYTQMQTIQPPLVFVFGDNEWTDCRKNKEQPFAPEERLARLRELFASGPYSLGRRPLKLNRQSDDLRFAPFRENVRWIYGPVLFVGFNLPGGANNFGQPEYAARNAANLVWLQEAFALARERQLRGIMLILQANPKLELSRSPKVPPGFKDFLAILEAETVAFKKPVVLVHGDSHYFRIDKPLVSRLSGRRIENFTRVETFGHPDAHWVRGTVDWKDPNVFSFRQEIVTKNLVPHGQ